MHAKWPIIYKKVKRWKSGFRDSTAILIFCKRGILVRAVVLCGVFLPQELVGPGSTRSIFRLQLFAERTRATIFRSGNWEAYQSCIPRQIRQNCMDAHALACHICVGPVHQNWRKGEVVFFQRKSYIMPFYEIPFFKCSYGSWQFLGCLLTTMELVELIMIYISLR